MRRAFLAGGSASALEAGLPEPPALPAPPALLLAAEGAAKVAEGAAKVAEGAAKADAEKPETSPPILASSGGAC